MFKVGDEVVCIKSRYGRVGMVFTVAAILKEGSSPPDACGVLTGGDAVQLNELPWVNDSHKGTWGYPVECFRKVQKRDLTAWLATENTIEGPVRKKVKA